MKQPIALLSISDFCERYGISRTSVYRQFNAGQIPIVKIGRATRIRTTDAEQWAANLPSQSIAA
jgi:excisionase family DNA binding protein